MWYIHAMEYYLVFKKWSSYIYNNIDEPEGNYAKWSKPVREGQILFIPLTRSIQNSQFIETGGDITVAGAGEERK
jgi:hypothetical protein